MDKNGEHRYDAAEGEAAGIAHKHLGGRRVIPQEAYQRPYECCHIYHKLLAAGHIHYVEVGGVYHVASEVGHGRERHTRYCRQAGGHTVESVVEVCTVARGCDYEHGYEQEHYPTAGFGVLAHPAGKPRVVEIVVLDKRNGGLRRLLHFVAIHYLLHPVGVVAYDLAVFHKHHRRAQIHCQSHYDGYAELPEYLVLALDAVFIALAKLQVVVEEAYGAEPHGGEQHHEHINIRQVAKQ